MGYNAYNYDYGSDNSLKGCLNGVGIVILCIVVIVLVHGCNTLTWVSDDAALERLEELMPEAESITIVRDDGNEIFFLHDPSDVTFELRVRYGDGRTTRPSARCRKEMFAEMVCRVYGEGVEPDSDG